MRIALATLCEDARFRDDGRLDLVGVAPDEVQLPQLPWEGSLVLALVLELSPDDDRKATGMNVAVIRAEDGSIVGEVDPKSAKQPREVPTGVDGPVHLPFRLSLDVHFEHPGLHRVLVRDSSGQPLTDVAFAVRATEG